MNGHAASFDPNGLVLTLPGGQQVAVPPHEEFYSLLITRNQGLVTPEDQQRLRRSNVLVAGCGSVGGAIIEPLIRIGAENLALAEPGEFDIPNMNRQCVRLQDVGRNKAVVFQERMREINPYAAITVDTRGLVPENVEPLVQATAVIIDAVDVTTKPALQMKWALHESAKRHQRPVICGYDIAGLQLLWIYDYRQPGQVVLDGRIRADEVPTMEPFQFLRRIIPISAISYEIIHELRRQIRGEREGFPQIVYTANLFGVLALPAAIELLAGRPIRRRIVVDVPHLLRTGSARLKTFFARLGGLYKLNNEFRQRTRDAAAQNKSAQ